MAEENTADPLEPLVLPDDISALSDEELEAAIAECHERSVTLNDDATLADLEPEVATELMENAIAVGEKLDAEATKREEAKAEDARILAETRARLAKRLDPDAEEEESEETPAEEEPVAAAEEVEEEEAEVAEEVELEPVLAAAKPAVKLRRQKANDPAASAPSGAKMIALADMPGKFQSGEYIDLQKASALFADRFSRTHRVNGPRQDMPLLRLQWDTPDERMLIEGDDFGNLEKMLAIVGPEALLASGGVCPPPEPYYDFQTLSGAQTPVVDSIPRFGANRGGIRWMNPLSMSDITTAVGEITNESDLLGGTNSTKTCQTVPCPTQEEAFVDALYHCLTISNTHQRTTPELIAHFTKLMMAAYARVRETKALDFLVAGSTLVTQAAFGGFSNTLLGGLLQAAEGMRNRNRMADTAVMRLWLPEWTLGAIAEDLIRQQFNRFDVLEAGGYKPFVTDYLRGCQIAPTFYVDSPSTSGQVFGAQQAGPLDDFPVTCVWIMAPEGTYVRLDNGTMDFGIVRDSVLNATNDFQEFGETFEAYAKLGTQSIACAVDVCPNGEVTLPVTQICGS